MIDDLLQMQNLNRILGTLEEYVKKDNEYSHSLQNKDFQESQFHFLHFLDQKKF